MVKGAGGTVKNWLENEFLKPVNVRERTFLTI